KLKHSSTPRLLNSSTPSWSGHRVDIYEAIRQGLNIDLQILRAGCDDESTWQQEYCCQFISTAKTPHPPPQPPKSTAAEPAKDAQPQSRPPTPRHDSER